MKYNMALTATLLRVRAALDVAGLTDFGVTSGVSRLAYERDVTARELDYVQEELRIARERIAELERELSLDPGT